MPARVSSPVAADGRSLQPERIAPRTRLALPLAFLSTSIGVLFWVGCEAESTPPGSALPSAGATPTLDCIAPIIIENCAGAGCHDSESRVHGMNLSTPSGIYEGLRDHGLDICHNRIVHRVMPGDPDDSFVINKVEGNLDCEQSLPMPPPPATPLSTREIELLRAWIAAGAPADCSEEILQAPSTGGSSGGTDGHTELHETSSSDGTTTAVTTTASLGGAAATASVGGAMGADGAAGTAGVGGTTNQDQTGLVCTTDMPCPGGNWNYACVGSFCAETWECFAHKPAPSSPHPCSMDVIPFCACDGTTFEAPVDCPDRPYTHAGACGDGHNCDVWKVNCDQEPPVCPEGELPSVVDDCWGDCVPATSCGCQYDWHCGDHPDYLCVFEALSCEPRPPEEP